MTTQVETAQATAEETLAPGSTPTEAAQPLQTPPEAVESSAAELKAEVAQLKQTLKSMEGRVSRGGVDPALQEQIDSLLIGQRRSEFRDAKRDIRESDLPAAEQARQLAEIEQREKTTEATQSLAEWRRDTLNEMVEDLGVSGIPSDDPKVSEFSNRWVAATTRIEAQRVRRDFNRYLISEPAARAKKAADDALAKAETARKRQNHEEGTLKAGAQGSPGGGGSDYLERLKSGKPLPPSQEIDALTAKFLR